MPRHRLFNSPARLPHYAKPPCESIPSVRLPLHALLIAQLYESKPPQQTDSSSSSKQAHTNTARHSWVDWLSHTKIHMLLHLSHLRLCTSRKKTGSRGSTSTPSQATSNHHLLHSLETRPYRNGDASQTRLRTSALGSSNKIRKASIPGAVTSIAKQ